MVGGGAVLMSFLDGGGASCINVIPGWWWGGRAVLMSFLDGGGGGELY